MKNLRYCNLYSLIILVFPRILTHKWNRLLTSSINLLECSHCYKSSFNIKETIGNRIKTFLSRNSHRTHQSVHKKNLGYFIISVQNTICRCTDDIKWNHNNYNLFRKIKKNCFIQLGTFVASFLKMRPLMETLVYLRI